MDCHAYLIVAHNNFKILEQLLRSLDHERNHFYVHIDRKVADVPWNEIQSQVQKGRLYFMPRVSVGWGGTNELKLQLDFFKCATKVGYGFYHYLSGVDLPVKKATDILAFFDRNTRMSFVEYSNSSRIEDEPRARYYHLFGDYVGRGTGSKTIRFIYVLLYYFIKLQDAMGINRLHRKGVTLYKNSAYFSVSTSLARRIAQESDFIWSVFRCTFCPVEHWLGTMIMKWGVWQDVNTDNLRYIDWSEGHPSPKTFDMSDVDKIKSSGKLFARKFDESHFDAVKAMQRTGIS